MPRGLLVPIILAFVVISQYINCANTTTGSVFGTATSNSIDSEDEASQSVRVVSTDVLMKCYQDHVQIGGTCNTGGATDNYIQYTISYGHNHLTWGTNPPVSSLRLAKCENGRFYAIVPKPNDPANITAPTTAGVAEYTLSFQIFTTVEGKTGYIGGEMGSDFLIDVEHDYNCSAANIAAGGS